MNDLKSGVEAKESSWDTVLPLALGGLLTVGFYALIPHLPAYQELVQRYFCSHPLEYASAGLFFAGLAVLLMKGFRFGSEHSILQQSLLESDDLLTLSNPVERAEFLSTSLETLSASKQSTWFARRIADVTNFVRGRKGTRGLEEHLKYLSELAVERLHGSYALVRTITWAVPIVGFLGTVIGITIAIANVTPDQLDSSLHEVTGGLAVAFDTTALALTLSIVLVFATFIVERSENQILSEVELVGFNQLAILFPEEEAGRPLIDAEKQAAEQLLAKTESLIENQTRLWQGSLQAMRERWTESLERQQNAWEETLHQGMSQTFGDHVEQLEQTRTTFLGALEQVSQRITAGTEQAQAVQLEQQQDFSNTLLAITTQLRNDNTEQQMVWKEQAETAVAAISRDVSSWQQTLKTGTEAANAQLQAMQEQGDALLRLVEAENQLAATQTSLSETLEALRTAESFDEALHNLSAAVHLLTAKSRPQAA